MIDFLNDALKDHSGQWQEYGISDQDLSANLNQYYDTICQDIEGKLIYSYNAILDNDSTNSPNVWRDDTDSIGTHFTAASGMFGSHYNLGPGCTVNDPGSASQYDIMSILSGIEVIQNDHDNNPNTEYSGSARGGYSWTELFY